MNPLIEKARDTAALMREKGGAQVIASHAEVNARLFDRLAAALKAAEDDAASWRTDAGETHLKLVEAEKERDLALAVASRRKMGRAADDTVGELLDNQAWIVLSHVASRLDSDADDLMEQWQDKWACGEVQKGYLSPHRAVAAWIARECNEIIRSWKARAQAAEAAVAALRELVGRMIDALESLEVKLPASWADNRRLEIVDSVEENFDFTAGDLRRASLVLTEARKSSHAVGVDV